MLGNLPVAPAQQVPVPDVTISKVLLFFYRLFASLSVCAGRV